MSLKLKRKRSFQNEDISNQKTQSDSSCDNVKKELAKKQNDAAEDKESYIKSEDENSDDDDDAPNIYAIDDLGKLNLSSENKSESDSEWEDFSNTEIQKEENVDSENEEFNDDDDDDDDDAPNFYAIDDFGKLNLSSENESDSECEDLSNTEIQKEENVDSENEEKNIIKNDESTKQDILSEAKSASLKKGLSIKKLKRKEKNLKALSVIKAINVPKAKADSIKKMNKNLPQNKPEIDDYATSDEEDLRNTIGNIPINWYDEYKHIGYGLDGRPIKKPEKGDALDQLLEKMENADSGQMVFDKQTGQNVKLSKDDVQLVKRLIANLVPSAQYNLHEPFQDLYSHEVEEMPLSGRALSKKSFIPSQHERQKVSRIAYLIRRGLYKTPLDKIKKNEIKKFKQFNYDLWKRRSQDDPKLKRVTEPIRAPKLPAPGHSQSYNPPPEYLMRKLDQNMLEGNIPLNEDKLFKNFWRKFSSVRQIPSYRPFIKNRIKRLEDLYLGDRLRYEKVVAKSRALLPTVPDKKDLRPYPTLEGLVFKGHRSIIRTISIHPSGKYLASGSDDHTVRVWETSTGRCLRTFDVGDVVKKVSWNPNSKLFMLGIVMGRMVVFLNPETYLTDKIVVQQTNSIFKEVVDQGDYQASRRVLESVTWRKPTSAEWDNGYRLVLDHFKEVKEIVWHRHGDYFVTLVPDGDRRSIIMHQLSRWRSQLPFQGNKGRVQAVAFHPKHPYLFLATQTKIRIYNLKRQSLLKKIQANSRWLSCIDIHPSGDNFIVGGYDRKVNWFETECTKRPHLMRYHGNAVRSVKFHQKYPLFASCSDDQKLFVVHATVFEDWVTDPQIVLLKRLLGHRRFDDYYVLDLAWHPYEPYLFSAGADATIRLWH